MGLYAIGDLHGCPDELEVLLAHLAPGADDTLVFLGDYVDRGAGVRTLVERLLRLREEGPETIFLRGNHEDMLLAYLGLPGSNGSVYLYNGGGPTLESYGVPADVSGPAAKAMIPAEHLQFFLECRLMEIREPFLFVHAGIRPNVPLADQSEDDMLWIREEFFGRPHDLPYVVVFGHTPQREARIELPYCLGLDTGLVYGNKLTCLDADGKRLLQVPFRGRRVVTRDLAPEFAAAGL